MEADLEDRVREAALLLADRKVLLFDLDGTLYSMDAYADFTAHMDAVTGRLLAARYGLDSPVAAALELVREQRLAGLPSKSATLERIHGIGIAAMNRHRERYVRPEDFIKPDPQLASTLEVLGRSYDLVLATNSTRLLARRILRCVGIDEARFLSVVDSEEVGCAKPEEGFFRHLLDRFPVPAARWVSIGDRPASDLDPARKLGMGAWLVKTPADIHILALGHDRMAGA